MLDSALRKLCEVSSIARDESSGRRGLGGGQRRDPAGRYGHPRAVRGRPAAGMDGLAFFVGGDRPTPVCRETEDGEGPAGCVHMTPVRRLLEEWMAMAMERWMGFPVRS